MKITKQNRTFIIFIIISSLSVGLFVWWFKFYNGEGNCYQRYREDTIKRLNQGFEKSEAFLKKFETTKWLKEAGEPDSLVYLKKQLKTMQENIDSIKTLNRLDYNNSCSAIETKTDFNYRIGEQLSYLSKDIKNIENSKEKYQLQSHCKSESECNDIMRDKFYDSYLRTMTTLHNMFGIVAESKIDESKCGKSRKVLEEEAKRQMDTYVTLYHTIENSTFIEDKNKFLSEIEEPKRKATFLEYRAREMNGIGYSSFCKDIDDDYKELMAVDNSNINKIKEAITKTNNESNSLKTNSHCKDLIACNKVLNDYFISLVTN